MSTEFVSELSNGDRLAITPSADLNRMLVYLKENIHRDGGRTTFGVGLTKAQARLLSSLLWNWSHFGIVLPEGTIGLDGKYLPPPEPVRKPLDVWKDKDGNWQLHFKTWCGTPGTLKVADIQGFAVFSDFRYGGKVHPEWCQIGCRKGGNVTAAHTFDQVLHALAEVPAQS